MLPKRSGGYAGSNYMVEVDWLRENLKNEDLLILDARGSKDYAKGHIPGAVNVEWPAFANMEGKPGDKGWGVTLDAARLSNAFSNIGVDKNKTIVVYADTKKGWGEDGRFLWTFRMAGVENSRMLNGGFNLWMAKGYAVSSEKVNPKPTGFRVEKLDEDFIVDTDWVKEHLRDAKILDSRSEEEYKGATKYGEARGGHIPGAIHVPYRGLFNQDGTLKSQDELESIFSAAGVTKDDEIATYCTAGIRSAQKA